MATFLTWASDVLEKVDQSAANLSDSGLERGRRSKESDDERLGVTSDDGEFNDSRLTQPLSASNGISTHKKSIWHPSSALYAAKSVSLPMENLKAARASIEGNEWVSSDLKEEFDDKLRKTSEAEAHVAALAAEIEKLQASTAMAVAVKEQEVKTLKREVAESRQKFSAEREAHNSAKLQAEVRASSLAFENSSYKTAMAENKIQAQERRMEISKLKDKIKELELEKSEKEEELERLSSELEAMKASRLSSAETSKDVQLSEQSREELRKQREEMDALRETAGRLESELNDIYLKNSKWPSRAHREKELERRLRSVDEQLRSKQAQAELLANEKATHQQKLEKTLEMLRALRGDADVASADRLKRNKIGRSLPPNSGIRDDSTGKLRPRLSDTASKLAAAMDSLSGFFGAALQRHSFARSFIVAYVLGLHLAVFVILSLAAAHRALRGGH